MDIENNFESNEKVLVIGGGVGGLRTALDLAEAGRNVVLVDRDRAIGGLMTQLDRTFPTNNCDLCTMSPHLSESARQRHIELMAMTQVTAVSGSVGNFTVTLATAPRHIDLNRCTACGDCLQKFPECVRFTPGLDHRAPTCMRYPQATPQAFSIDLEKCADIPALRAVCPAGAIVIEDGDTIRQMVFSSIVLATGAEIFDPAALDHFGYASLPDVVTSLEYERILSASGPTQGQLLRPSNGQPPRRIAWIQCVGSRGLQRGSAAYCSSACCMFAIKEAMVTKERFQDSIETTIFFMDMRTCGKDYEKYYQRAADEFGVRFVRCRPHSVVQTVEDQTLAIGYLPETGAFLTEEFDMVVLATGFRVSEQNRKLAEILGIALNEHGFPDTAGFNPVVTSKPGIYVCGMCQSPKDIPETMVQASAAASMAAADLPARVQQPDLESGVAERDVSGEPPRVGVFICDCGLNIGGVIDVDRLAKYAAELPEVEVAEAVGHGCSREAMERIEQVIAAGKINRVVIGGCSPRTHEQKFQDLLRKAGLNKYLVEIANIRDQITWVHRDKPEQAAEKAQELIRMAVTGVSHSRPLVDQTLPMNKDILVVGGGVAGMTAAVQLANQGFKVVVAERSKQLGGNALNLRRTLEGQDVSAFIGELIRKTKAHENIQVLTQALIVDHSGMPGLFTTGMQIGPQFYRQIRHGVTILATGALANRPSQYLLGAHDAVMTQLDLGQRIEADVSRVKQWETVVMIQCVGSRSPENPNCSRICCQAAVKNALHILDVNPEARIFVLYRDIRTYGLSEPYYTQARARGVIFVRFEPDHPPVVQAEGAGVSVSFRDPVLERELVVSADCLALSTGMVADEEATEDLAAIFHLARTEDGYFLEEHVKLRPVDLSTPGFFVAGTAHGPKNLRETVAQAQAAASRAQTMLARDVINLGAAVAKVESQRCAACLVCVRACPFGIPFINADGYSQIDPATCHGCGVCAAECPAKAISLMQFEDDQILAKLDGLLERMIA
jgi:heterodisulfide reductase subunit A